MPHVELPQAEFKVVLLGDTNTGKTSLVLRFVEGYYRADGRSATIGAFFLTKRITVDSITCKMLLWDTAGQEQFQKLAKTYYSTAAAAILAYDITQPNSLLRLSKYIDEVTKNTAGRKIVLIIAACKCDLNKSNVAAPGLQQEAQRLAQSCGATYIETSAKDNSNVHELFATTAQLVLQSQADAVNGTGLHIPVTVGGKHNGSIRTSNSNSNNTNNNNNNIGRSASSPPSTAATAKILSANNNNNSDNTIRKNDSSTTNIMDKATPDTDSSTGGATTTDPTNDDNVVDDDKNNETIPNNSNVMCEGSLLVCGTDDKSCFIM